MKLNEAKSSSAEIDVQMEEEISCGCNARFLFRKLVVDAESIQSDYDARDFIACSEAEE